MVPRLRVRRVLADALYGQVLECDIGIDEPNNPTRVAVKCVELDLVADTKCKTAGIRSVDDPFQEARVAQAIMDAGGHPNVVQPILQLHHSDEMMLVSELCEGGDLYNYMSARRDADGGQGPIDATEATGLMRQVLRGVLFLHDQVGIAHRDLSLENVLISSSLGLEPADNDNQDITLKISDFGLSVSANNTCSDVAGKDIYMAPEVVDRSVPYDPIKADIWSLGIMWFVLITGSQLFSCASKSDPTMTVIEEHGVSAVFSAWGYRHLVKSPTAELISQMLRVDPAERIDVASILAHPVLSG